MNLLHFLLPSLISLNLTINQNSHTFQDSFKSFAEFSPNLRTLCINMAQVDVAFSNFLSRCICQWQNLQTVTCPLVVFTADALMHLSHMPALTGLYFTLPVILPASNTLLCFPNLTDMKLRSGMPRQAIQLLSQTRLPTIRSFITFIGDFPSKPEFHSFLAGVQTSGAGNVIEELRLRQLLLPWNNALRPEAVSLRLDDLRTCVRFRNLRIFHLKIRWNVDLADNDLLTLSSAWPHLEEFIINDTLGWNTRSGITPDGLLQLLKICRSLRCIALAMDARGYTEVPRSPENLRVVLSDRFIIDVLDSTIEAESVPALSAFFANVTRAKFGSSAWCGMQMVKPPGWEVHQERWNEVFRQANKIISQRS